MTPGQQTRRWARSPRKPCLRGHVVVAEGGSLAQPAAALGAGQAAHGHGDAVQDREPRVVRGGLRSRQVAPQALLDLPQVGGLAREGGAVHAGERREEVGVVAAEVAVDALVGGDAQERAHALDGQHLAVGQGRRRAAGPQPLVVQAVLHGVVDPAERDYNELVQVHREPPEVNVEHSLCSPAGLG